MSEELKTYYDFAQFSLAAYFPLPPGPITAATLVNEVNGFSQGSAAKFTSQYVVLDQRSVGGMTATLFQALSANGQPAGTKFLAIRGTDGFLDTLSDLNIAFGSAGLFDVQYQALKGYYELLSKPVEQGGLGLIATTEKIAITGHSLGGYLAQTFTADPTYSS